MMVDWNLIGTALVTMVFGAALLWLTKSDILKAFNTKQQDDALFPSATYKVTKGLPDGQMIETTEYQCVGKDLTEAINGVVTLKALKENNLEIKEVNKIK